MREVAKNHLVKGDTNPSHLAAHEIQWKCSLQTLLSIHTTHVQLHTLYFQQGINFIGNFIKKNSIPFHGNCLTF